MQALHCLQEFHALLAISFFLASKTCKSIGFPESAEFRLSPFSRTLLSWAICLMISVVSDLLIPEINTWIALKSSTLSRKAKSRSHDAYVFQRHMNMAPAASREIKRAKRDRSAA